MKKLLRRAAAAAIAIILLTGAAPRAKAADRINILLIGLDRRPGLEGCRSDTVILCSCDPVSGKLDLISFLRDLYLPVPGHGSDRLNAAYAMGGMSLLKETLEKMRGEGHKSIAVITRTQAQADSLSAKLENVYRLDGGEEDFNYESTDNVVGCYHMVKGMEFDAVIVVWPEAELTDGERRRLYTACSRALHSVALLGGGKLIKELGIVL